MVPFDSEFMALYVAYFMVLVFLILGFAYSKKYKERFKLNIIFFSIYFCIFLFPFFNENNFKGGNSLGVLVFGLFYLLVHLSVFLVRGLRHFVVKWIRG